MGCGGSTAAAPEAKYVAPEPTSPAQQQSKPVKPASTTATAQQSPSQNGGGNTAPASPTTAGGGGNSSSSNSSSDSASSAVATSVLYTSRIVLSSLPAAHARFQIFKGAGTSWGLCRAAAAGSVLSAATPSSEWIVVAPGAPGDNIRVGVLPRSAQAGAGALAKCSAPGDGPTDAAAPPSIGWSCGTGAILVAGNKRAEVTALKLRYADRLSVHLRPSADASPAAAAAAAAGAHTLQFFNGSEMIGSIDVSAAEAQHGFVPCIALQGGATVLWSGESVADGQPAKDARHALKAAGRAWKDAEIALRAEQKLVKERMQSVKAEAEQKVAAQAALIERQEAEAAALALAQRLEHEKLERAEKQAARMSDLDNRRRSGGNGGTQVDPLRETADAVAEFERQESLALDQRAAEEAALLAAAEQRQRTRAELKRVRDEEAARTRKRLEKLQARALRILTNPVRHAAEQWRAYTERRRQQRHDNTLPSAEEVAAAVKRRKAEARKSGGPLPVAKLVAPPIAMAMGDVAAAVSSFRTLPKVKQLNEHVTLEQYDGKCADGLQQYEWIVRNNQLEQLVVELNFERCKGMDLHGTPVQKSVLKGWESKLIAVITQASLRAGYAMSYTISCTTLPPDLADIAAANKADEELIAQARARMDSSGIDAEDVGVTWSDVHRQVAERERHQEGFHFLDVSFPPLASSVWSQGADKSELDRSLPLAWRRLFSFLPEGASPSFYDPIADPNDIQQGSLGNCWFCSALSAVGETPSLVSALFGKQQRINSVGVYSVRLCVTGLWREVIVDDFFPCYPGAGPIFTQNHGQQTWVLLVEKAYGKLVGSYDRLISGQAHHALADLTGCPVVVHQLEHAEAAPLLANDAAGLWSLMLADAQQDLSMCAGTVGKENATDAVSTALKSVGLIAGHAYSLLNCFSVPLDCSTSQGARLLELRNPWGSGEWKGAWSDSSPLWTAELKARLKPNLSDDDGIFYMELTDFLQYFSSVATCYIRAPNAREWATKRMQAQWVSTADAAAASSSAAADAAEAFPFEPSTCFTFDVAAGRPTDIWVAIYQPDPRLKGASALVDQGVMVLKLESDGSVQVVADTTMESSRQSNCPARLTEPGRYLIVPYTSGGKLADLGVKSRAFNVALFSDDDAVSASCRPCAYDRSLFLSALGSLCSRHGSLDKLGKSSQLWMSQYRWGSSCHVYACAIDPAAAAKDWLVTLDNTSVNARSHRRDPKYAATVRAGDRPRVFHLMTPVDDSKPTSYNVGINFKAIKPAAA